MLIALMNRALISDMAIEINHHPECSGAVSCLCGRGHRVTELKVEMDIANAKDFGGTDLDIIVVDLPQTKYDEIKRVPGSTYLNKYRKFSLPLTWASCVIMRAMFRDSLIISPKLAQWSRDERQNRIDPALVYRTATEAKAIRFFQEGLESRKHMLYDFQEAGVAFMANSRYVLNGDEMRVGKSPQSIMTLRYLREHEKQEVFPTLVVCPPNVKRVWKEHFEMFWPEARVVAPKSGLAAAEKAIKEVKDGNADVLVIHYEVLALLSNLEGYGGAGKLKPCVKCAELVKDEKTGELVPNKVPESKCQIHPKALNGVDWQSIIADEAHRIGEASALMTRALKKLSRKSPVRLALTGTPPEDPDRLWSVMNFVSPQEYPSKGKFRQMFAHVVINPWSGFEETAGWRSETKPLFEKFFFPRFIRRPKAAVHGNFVEAIHEVRYPEMSPKQATAYKALQQTMIAELDNGIFWTDSPLVKIARLRQLASAYGEVVLEEDEEGVEKIVGMRLSEPSSKLDALDELLEELGNEPAVIMAEQAQLIELAAIRIGDRTSKIIGGQSDSARNRAIDDFQQGRVQYVLATTSAGGEGISLNRADTLIFLQRPWSLSASAQAEARIYKEGTAGLIIDIITPDTIDEKVLRTLSEKGDKLEDLVKDADTVREWLKK